MTRERAHVVFAKTRVGEWTAHPELRCGFASRTPIARVVEIEAVQHGICTACCRSLDEAFVQFALAEITAVRRIRGIPGILNLARDDDLVLRAGRARRRNRRRFFALRQTRGVRRY